MELSQIEKLSVTYELTHSLAEWDKSSRNPFMGMIGSRVVGVLATPIAGIIDALAHLVIAAVKFVTGLFISPYNFIAGFIDIKYKAPADLELSSAAIHLFLAFKSIVFIPIVAVTAGFSPELASQNADSRIIFRSKPKPFSLNLDFSI